MVQTRVAYGIQPWLWCWRKTLDWKIIIHEHHHTWYNKDVEANVMSRFKRPCYHVIELKTHLVIEKQIKKPLTFLYANLRISSYSSWPMERNRVNAKGVKRVVACVLRLGGACAYTCCVPQVQCHLADWCINFGVVVFKHYTKSKIKVSGCISMSIYANF